jgi:hypothetical protein
MPSMGHCMSSHSRAEGRMRKCHCLSALKDLTTRKKAACRTLSDWMWRNKRAEDLQDGKLARFNNKDRGEHEANTGSKHRQGCDEEPTKDEQAVPPTHCGYWLAEINMNHEFMKASLLHPRW